MGFSVKNHTTIALSLSFVLACFTSVFAKADDLEASSPLTITQAMIISINSHPLVLARQGEYQATLGELSATQWSAFPSVSYSAQSIINSDNQKSVSLSQPVWTGGRLSGNIELAEARRDVAKSGIIEAEQILLEDTVKSFFDLHRAETKLQISTANVAEHKRLYDIIARRVTASTSPEVDAMLAKARLAFARSQALQFMSAQEVARSELEQLIGQPFDDIAIPTDSRFVSLALSDFENMALAFSPRLKSLQFEADGLDASVKIAASMLYPQVTIGYEKKFGDLLFAQEREQVFIGLEFQPGAGLSSRSTISASKARKRSALQTLSASRRDLRRRVQIAWREYEAAQLQLAPTQQLVSATTKVVDSYLRQYTVGRKSWLDVLNAQREVVQAQHTLADYQALSLQTSFQLQILSGELTRQKLMGSDV
jgi:adhesin transport system outer membrane protein